MTFRSCSRLWKMSRDILCKNIKSLSKEATSHKSEQEMYEKAIETLNSIQTISGSTSSDHKKVKQEHAPLTQVEKFDEIKHLPVDDFKKLAAIHVAGTKGKGSVCAFCESILRKSGYKTGFYSSPHVFEVRERMRINGRSISKHLFTKYFWECWESFEVVKKRYYKTFLVFMAFHVFLKEKVDVAIVEVHCGGEYDVTNILRHPVVCGVTLLDKDHLKTLGGTVETIAWHKAGIFKPGAPCFTVPQDPASMKVLQERATERKTSLKIVPDLPTKSDGVFPALGIQGKHQHKNASLAVHLCRTWIERNNVDDNLITENKETSNPETRINFPAYANAFSLPESFLEGLASTVWPGRTQCIERDHFTFYLDGAHTRKSIEACSQWFCEKSEEERTTKSHLTMAKVLIFNFKGARDPTSLLEPLVKCDFDYVIFCPNSLNCEAESATSDTFRFSQDIEEDQKKCFKNQEIWKEVLYSNTSPSLNTSNLNSQVFACVSDAFHWVVGDRNDSSYDRKSDTLRDVLPRADHMQVFVTGSLYLVGIMLKLLEHEIVDSQ